MPKKIAVYPGTFDPVTLGHLDVLRRASKLFDKVIIAVAKSSQKTAMFSVDDRVALIKQSVRGIKNIEVDSFNGLLVNYAKRKKASAIVRGLRAISDFEYEFQMALTNGKLAPNIETVFLMPSEKYSFISSSLVREVAKNRGNVSYFVPKAVVQKLKAKY